MIGLWHWPHTTPVAEPSLKPSERRTKDFALRLPRETQAYVPRLLAISAIVANQEAFDIELPPVEN